MSAWRGVMGSRQANAAMLQTPDHAPAFVSVENQFPE